MRAERARADNVRDDRSSALADSVRDDRSRVRADSVRELNALAETGVISSNAADITSSHAFFDMLIPTSPHSQVNDAPPGNRWYKETVPKFTAFGKENFTKNINAKLTMPVNLY